MIKALALTSLMFTACVFQLFSQAPKESWRDHLAYNRGYHVAVTPEKVFYAAYKSGMLSYNRHTGEVEKHSKVTGLSDIDVSTLEYSSDADLLIIGYRSGNIDLLTRKGTVNLPDIKNKRMIASKTINKILVSGQFAYLACDFGIVVLDLAKKEIKDSYIFGIGGSTIKVNDITIFDGNIYAATESGIYKAALQSPNLLDYSSWQLQNNIEGFNSSFVCIASFDEKLFAVQEVEGTKRSIVLVSENDVWEEWGDSFDTVYYNLNVYNNVLGVIAKDQVRFYNSQFQQITGYDLPGARHALIANDGVVYTAGMGYGFYLFDNNQGKYLGVNGPRFNSTGFVSTTGKYVWVGSGGPFRPYLEGGAHVFSDNRWESYNNGYTDALKDVGNLYKFAFYPGNPERVFASGYMYGLYEFLNGDIIKSHTWENTPLFSSTIDQKVAVRIKGLDFDSDNNLWTIMDETDQPVYILRNNGEWENLSLQSSVFTSPGIFVDLEVTFNNQVWILSGSKGIVVLKENSDGTVSENAFPLKNKDGELLTVAYCLTEDKDGNIWVGTNKGPIIYSPSDDIFTQNDVRGYQVKIPQEDGEEGAADYLLDYEILNEIAVDGGNRKWIATENSGVFLVSADGKNTIHNFTTDNSPLISNNIIGIGVNETTGEVFMSTNYGMVSYMGTSTEGGNDFTNVYTFPNPVRPGYNRLITITGLIRGTNVKITDISGNIVYETISEGGQAVWDGKNFYGNRVSTGVYLIFLTNDDGSKTHITKVLFIH
ncbi:MAG: T9SS type A sorting domain-containing protein [Bacteroidales bacterium]|nr:T9SS type A sorting domain-containing protein [Bacteroidales bacterium]